MHDFDDVIAANRSYADGFSLQGLEPRAARGLGILLCMDSRIEPLGMLGLEPGDAKILRNAGARVTPDVIRSLVLGVHLLGVERVLVVPHTKCGTLGEADTIRAAVRAAGGDPGDLDLGTTSDQDATLRADLEVLRSSPHLPSDLAVAGAVYDVDTGLLGPLVA